MAAIIGTVGVPACYGGFETLVDNLLDEEGDHTVYCSSKSYDEKLSSYKGARLVYLPFNANGISSVIYDVLSMFHAAFGRHKVLLVLGVSACLILPFLRLCTKKKIVVNIDGLEWRRDKWNWLAKRYLKLAERLAVSASNIVIADNQAIADYVLNEYGVVSEVIAYGGDHVIVHQSEANVSGGYALGLCRIEPENNVHLILSAFEGTKYRLKFVGNWGNSAYGRELKGKYQTSNNIELIDPVYDIATLYILRSECDYYIHGHSAGGTNPSLVEMMHFSKVIICFDCVYNRATTEDKALYFKTISDLKLAVSGGVLIKHEAIGAEMLEIAQRRYTWKIVRAQYLSLLK